MVSFCSECLITLKATLVVETSPKADTNSGSPRGAIDRYFEIVERGSTIGREVRGGIVTFVTMAYIVVLNPIILTTTTDVAGTQLDFGQVGVVHGAHLSAS